MQTTIIWPELNDLLKMQKELGSMELARKLGVARQTVWSRIKRHKARLVEDKIK